MPELNTESLASCINEYYQRAEQSKNEAIIYAAQCGAYLNQAKAQCPHGEWDSWLSRHCHVKARQARRFMRLAREMPELLSIKRSCKSDFLSINTVLAILDSPDLVKTRAQQEQQQGKKVTTRDIERWRLEHDKNQKNNADDACSDSPVGGGQKYRLLLKKHAQWLSTMQVDLKLLEENAELPEKLNKKWQAHQHEVTAYANALKKCFPTNNPHAHARTSASVNAKKLIGKTEESVGQIDIYLP